jgi:serine/threonine-protein kinase
VPDGWDGVVLKKIERQLAAYVGPFARLMVRKAAAATTSLDVLYTALAEGIENQADRTAFLAAPRHDARASVTAGTAAGPTLGIQAAARPDTASLAVSPETIALATEQLAPFLGPIAKVVARRAAARCADRRQFFLLVAADLADAQDRARFLHAVGVEG